MSRYYQQIMQLKEAEELKKTVSKWKVLSENIKEKPINKPIILPDMFWVAKPGVGRTNLLRLMSEFLYEQGNLMDFYGDVKFFEFLLSYCPSNSSFTELHRLMNEVDNAAGFRSEYKGVIHIDVNEWIGHFEEAHFVSFMEYLASNSDNWLIILSVTSVKHPKLHDFEAFVSMFLRIEKITLSLPKTEDLLAYVQSFLQGYGLTLDNVGKKIIRDTINVLRKNKYFDGYKSIKMLCQDIVYAAFSKGKVKKYELTADILEAFSAESDYVKRTIIKIEKVNKIGFL